MMGELLRKSGRVPARSCRLRGLLAAIVVLVSAALTSSCGFKLRGQVEIPAELNPMYIQAPAASPVRGVLVEQLRGSQVRLATQPKDARVILRILSESHSTRVAALDRNGKALAYELHYHLTFDAVAPGGKQLVPLQSLDLLRTYENPDVQVLGKQLEAALIYEDLTADSANQILARLRAVLL